MLSCHSWHCWGNHVGIQGGLPAGQASELSHTELSLWPYGFLILSGISVYSASTFVDAAMTWAGSWVVHPRVLYGRSAHKAAGYIKLELCNSFMKVILVSQCLCPGSFWFLAGSFWYATLGLSGLLLVISLKSILVSYCSVSESTLVSHLFCLSKPITVFWSVAGALAYISRLVTQLLALWPFLSLQACASGWELLLSCRLLSTDEGPNRKLPRQYPLNFLAVS